MVIDGCPYKEKQKDSASETCPSTTPSQVSTLETSVETMQTQISTLNSDVLGKADSDDIITGGSYSDGLLTLNKASGNIYIAIELAPVSQIINVQGSYKIEFSSGFIFKQITYTFSWDYEGDVDGYSATISTSIEAGWTQDHTQLINISETISDLTSRTYSFTRSRVDPNGWRVIEPSSTATLNISNGQKIDVTLTES